MNKIDFNEYSPFHKTGHTSKGDQRKWEVDGTWYKADYMGYEGLSEILVSRLLQKSNIKYPFVLYDSVFIEYNGTTMQGCMSKDFLTEDQDLVTLEKLYRQYTGKSLASDITQFAEIKERIQYLVEQIEKITNIKEFGKYLTAILEIDAFFLNEDRHTNNLAVIYNEKTQKYALSPVFDQGLSLFSDIRQDYPLTLPVEECMEKIEAKPFDKDFDEQVDAAESLYGVQLQFYFTIDDVKKELDQISTGYPDGVRLRIEELLRNQIRKYSYFMK